MNIPIAYEDEWLLVVDKPSGLLTVPTPKNEQRTLTSILNLYPCHRLDRETSGLIIYAKDKSVQQKMMDEFRDREVKKTYIAFIRGVPYKNAGEIKNKIEGLSAATRYKVIAKRKDFAIVEVHPLTGRTNQIRIHFKQIGHPILGETKYAFRKDFKIKAKRLMLQAKELSFPHPVTGAQVQVRLDLAMDMAGFLEKHPH
ncbi:MAG: RluA family pseudouridine synthase [Candidatus Omnitrophica bacterium]|nr:RluA family pseudouridine synthase [Candidatus Omnitrophota bacterium]